MSPADPAAPEPVDEQGSPPRDRPSAWRWLLRVVVAVVVVLGLLAAPMACTTRILPPIGVQDPVTVFLLDHGRTPSLVIPEPSGGMVRYAYGDWRWYALADTGIWNGIAALFWPTRGTLGRLPMQGPVTLSSIDQQLTVPSENVYLIVVERQAAFQLQQELDRIYQDHAHTLIHNEAYELHFVHHPRSYTYFNNSNHAVARWLRSMGCRVIGPAFASRWRVDPPAEQ
jgi:hypothetical protein